MATNYSQQDIAFLKAQKQKGVDASTALAKLQQIKTAQPSSAPATEAPKPYQPTSLSSRGYQQSNPFGSSYVAPGMEWSAPDPNAPLQQGPIENLARGVGAVAGGLAGIGGEYIAKPIARTAAMPFATGYRSAEGLAAGAGALFGGQGIEGARQAMGRSAAQPVDLPGLGNVNPITATPEGNISGTETARKGIGQGLEGGAAAASFLPGFGIGKMAGISGTQAFGGALQQEGATPEAVLGATVGGAALGAAGPFIGKLSKPLQKVMKEKLPSRFINRILKPKDMEFNFGKNPGLAVAREGVTANSLEGLQKGISGKLKELGTAIGASAKKGTGTFNAENFLAQEVPRVTENLTDPNTAAHLQNVINALTFNTKFVDGKLVKTAPKALGELTAPQLHDFQKKLGALTKWTGAPGEKEVNKILQEWYGQVGKQLEQMAPGTKKLQRRYADMLGAEKSIQNQIVKANKASLMGNTLTPTLGGLAGFSSGDNLEDRVRNALIGVAASKIPKALGKPAIATRAAKALATPIVKATQKKAPALLQKAAPAVASAGISALRGLLGGR